MGVLPTVAQLNRMVLKPFGEQVDVQTVALLLVLVLALAGAWHLTLERIEL
jgi:hypothetical protein